MEITFRPSKMTEIQLMKLLIDNLAHLYLLLHDKEFDFAKTFWKNPQNLALFLIMKSQFDQTDFIKEDFDSVQFYENIFQQAEKQISGFDIEIYQEPYLLNKDLFSYYEDYRKSFLYNSILNSFDELKLKMQTDIIYVDEVNKMIQELKRNCEFLFSEV